MRRNFKKMLTVAVAAAMVVTAVPMQPAQAAQVTTFASKAPKTVKVSTQKELNKALKDDSVTKIKIKTEEDTTFKIKEGDYTDKKVVVDAPNAEVKNKGGEFAKVKGKEVGTWIEKAEGNKFVITSQDSKIVVKKSADVESITYKGEGAKAELKVQGTVGTVTLEAQVEMTVAGKAEKVTLVVTETAKGSTITATITIKVTAETDVKIELGEGAEGSSVTTTDETVKVEVENGTKEDVTVTTPAGEETVGSGSEGTVGGSDSTGGESTDGGSTGGGSTGSGAGGGGSAGGGSTGDDSAEEAVKITGAYNGTDTVYTLTGADSFEALKSVTVKAQAKDGDTTIGNDNIVIAITEQLLNWKAKTESYLVDDTTEVNGVTNWVNVTDKTYTYDGKTMTITGIKGEDSKLVTISEAGNTYEAYVRVAHEGNNIVAQIAVANAGQATGEELKITVISADEFTVSRNNGTAYTFKLTDTTITVKGYNTTSTESNFYLEFTAVTK